MADKNKPTHPPDRYSAPEGSTPKHYEVQIRFVMPFAMTDPMDWPTEQVLEYAAALLDADGASVCVDAQALTVAKPTKPNHTAADEMHPVRWAWFVNDSVCNELTDVTPAEAEDAMHAFRMYKGIDYTEKWLKKQHLDTEDREELARIITQRRQIADAATPLELK